jgi:enoyl-CoA hydratase
LATIRLGRKHGNALNSQLIDELYLAYGEAAADPVVRGVLLASSGKLFSPGLDLQELIELDRPAMRDFLLRFNDCVLRLYSFEKPVLAAIQGHAVAGGCVLTLTADWRMLVEDAMVGLNELRVGVPFPFGVALILRESVSPFRLEEVAMFGRNYRGTDAIAAGLVHEVLPAAGFERRALERLDELAGKDTRAFAITKRYLRGATVERIRAQQEPLEGEFLDGWFSAETQERIRAIVEQLSQEGG